ncbi:hypothetical protein ANANG_G00319710 [Anguilla anguilla]|uniref:Ig-like domain-containing protein n=1 Tax=Anguilla anguilla TaxID=7936 RepID=A0A9D3LHM7_ANGAN|nr:hypothetical protein ANANG_G00319710 [Anguilla anguilla]
MEMTWILDNAHQTITCEVKHPSGRNASKIVSLQGQCSVTKVTINPSSEEFLEGVEKDVVCSVSYACQEHRPDLSWNYGDMKVSSEFKKRGSGSWESRSTLTFKAGASDHNQALKCTARFTNGQIQEGYITLKVKSEFSQNERGPFFSLQFCMACQIRYEDKDIFGKAVLRVYR